MSLKKILALVSLGCGLAFGIMMFVSIETSMHVFTGLSTLDFKDPVNMVGSIMYIIFLVLMLMAILLPGINLLIAVVSKKDELIERKTGAAAIWNSIYLFVLVLFILLESIVVALVQGLIPPENIGELVKDIFLSAEFIVPLVLVIATGIMWGVAARIENQIARIVLYAVGAAALLVMFFVFFRAATQGAAGIIAVILLVIQILLVVFLAVMPVIGLDKQEQKAE